MSEANKYVPSEMFIAVKAEDGEFDVNPELEFKESEEGAVDAAVRKVGLLTATLKEVLVYHLGRAVDVRALTEVAHQQAEFVGVLAGPLDLAQYNLSGMDNSRARAVARRVLLRAVEGNALPRDFTTRDGVAVLKRHRSRFGATQKQLSDYSRKWLEDRCRQVRAELAEAETH